MWLQECINALFAAGLNNDKLPLLFLSNSSAQVAIKTSTGLTDRISILNIVMQGTVWGSIFCVALMDQLVKLAKNNKQLLFYYKGIVPIPPLEMVDDVLGIQKCGTSSVALNGAINTFMEAEKLTLSRTKCHQIHIGKKCGNMSSTKSSCSKHAQVQHRKVPWRQAR